MPDAIVRASTLGAFADGSSVQFSQDKMGNLVTSAVGYDLARRGRAFEVSNAVKQTALATGGTAYSDTAPAFIVDAPSGTTLVPTEIILNQGGTVAGGVITVLITIDNIARYSSGGTALTVRPTRTDAPVATSVVSAYSTSPTAAALGIHNSLWSAILVQGVTNTASSTLDAKVAWRYDANHPVFLVGPASLVIYSYAAVTQPSWFFRIAWLEIPTTSI